MTPDSEFTVAHLSMLNVNILTASMIPWVLQNNIDPDSDDFENAFDTMIDSRDRVFSLMQKYYKIHGLES